MLAVEDKRAMWAKMHTNAKNNINVYTQLNEIRDIFKVLSGDFSCPCAFDANFILSQMLLGDVENFVYLNNTEGLIDKNEY